MATEVIPSARRLISSLRDLGYSLPAALADLVDNSIAAAATRIDIDTQFDGEYSWVRVVDNGSGMSERQLQEAMRFGTRRSYEDGELGRFGLGLKSASLSQCRCVTVATRTSLKGRPRLAQWDLEHVEDTDRWEVLRPLAGDVPLACDPLQGRAGTVVLWEELDRITRYRFPDGRRAEDEFGRICAEIDAHLGMTFHRFIRSDRPLMIRLNGATVEGWDPFSADQEGTLSLPVQHLPLTEAGVRQPVAVRPYVLPTESRYSSSEAHSRAAGPRHWSRQQGFYIYRHDRLIQAGGWNRLRTQDEHTKLARIAVDLPPGSESLFELNVAKTQVRFPIELRAELATIAGTVCRLAEESYRSTAHAEVPVAEHEDPRLGAVGLLVRMVMGSVDGVLRRELAGHAPLLARVRSKIGALETEVVGAVAAQMGLTDDASGE